MSKVTQVAGYVWAAPLTLLGLIYVNLFTLLGWYRHLGTFGDALAWEPKPHCLPPWLARHWHLRAGQSLGNVAVLNVNLATHTGQLALHHEQDCIRQAMTLGPLYPVAYAVVWAAMKAACPRSNPHFSHPFAVEARRAAGQLIDVEGAYEKLRAHHHPAKGD